MAEIICMECKAVVSDASGYCPECGYPFHSDLPELNVIAVPPDEAIGTPQEAITTPPPDLLLQSLNSMRVEMNELQRTITDIKQNFDSHAVFLAENTQKTLSAVAVKLDEVILYNNKKEAEAQAIAAKETKKGALAAFYRTLNSPDSMFEYMFYITVVQIIFVVVNLFLVTYIVTLVR